MTPTHRSRLVRGFARRALFCALASALMVSCSGARFFVVQRSPPGRWRGVRAFALNTVSWRNSRVDGLPYGDFENILVPERRGRLLEDITLASGILAETVRARVRGVQVVSGRGLPEIVIEVLSWERGYYSMVPKATELRVRVSLVSHGRPDDVVDFVGTYHHSLTQPHPAAGVRNAAELIADEFSVWLMNRVVE